MKSPQPDNSKQAEALSELLVTLKNSLEPTETFSLGWFRDAWVIEVELDNSLKKRPLKPSAYGRTGNSPLEAAQSMFAALRQDKVIDLVNKSPEATNDTQ